MRLARPARQLIGPARVAIAWAALARMLGLEAAQRSESRDLDADYEVDVQQIKSTLDIAEVTSLYFPFLGKSLIIDLRTNGNEGPFLKVVEQVETADARLRSLRRLRPRFPRPESLSLIPWPKRVDSLVRLGVWDHIEARCGAVGPPEIVETCHKMLQELLAVEAAQLRNSVRGQGFDTIWQRR